MLDYKSYVLVVLLAYQITNALFLFWLQQIKAIADTGVKVIVTGGKVGDLALHYANKYKLMIVRLLSKWDLRRLCKSVGATALPKLVCKTVCHF